MIFDWKKLLTKFLVYTVIGAKGLPAWAASFIISWALKQAEKKGIKLIDHIQDNSTIKIGDKLEQMEPTDQVKKDRIENGSNLIEGK
jgi:hypothetical protein